MPQLLTADQVEFWHHPEKAGWMYSQGEHIRTWRKRWFVLKQVRRAGCFLCACVAALVALVGASPCSAGPVGGSCPGACLLLSNLRAWGWWVLWRAQPSSAATSRRLAPRAASPLLQGFLFRFASAELSSGSKPRGIVDLSQVGGRPLPLPLPLHWPWP